MVLDDRYGWTSPPPEDWGRYPELDEEDDRRQRGWFRRIFGRRRADYDDSEPGDGAGRGRYWPGPLGGTVAVILIVTVVLAIPAVVVASWARGGIGGDRAEPKGPPPAAAGEPTPNFGGQSYPPWAGPGADPSIPTGDYLAPAIGDPSALPGQSGPLPSPLPGPYPVPSRGPAGGGAGGGGAGGGGPGASPGSGGTGGSAGRFVAVTGGGCPATATTTYFAAYRAAKPVANLSGGWTGPGCTDRFWSVPMSGSATADDPGIYVLWSFVTAPVRRGRCGVWTYVPKGPRDADAAGDPTFYDVLHSRDDRTVIGKFSIKQAPARGTWAHGGEFDTEGGQIAIKLNNRGAGSGGRRHGAAQVLVNCVPR